MVTHITLGEERGFRVLEGVQSMNEHIQKLRAVPETAAVFTRWTADEEAALLGAVRDGHSVGDMARVHHRTASGIRSRLKHIAVDLVTSKGKTVEEASGIVGLAIEAVTLALARRGATTVPTLDIVGERARADAESTRADAGWAEAERLRAILAGRGGRG